MLAWTVGHYIYIFKVAKIAVQEKTCKRMKKLSIRFQTLKTCFVRSNSVYMYAYFDFDV